MLSAADMQIPIVWDKIYCNIGETGKDKIITRQGNKKQNYSVKGQVGKHGAKG